jgi:cyclopropane fatty-acyl-phospholipid synthase-like methyltransferase
VSVQIGGDENDLDPVLGKVLQAEALAGAERMRVWRLYLRAAGHGFEKALTAVYQVLARRPA